MKRIGKIIMSVGAFISVTGACALDSDGLIYSRVLLIIMIGIIIALAGYGLKSGCEASFWNILSRSVEIR